MHVYFFLYFNLNRIISINAEFGGGVGFFTDGKGYQSGGSSVAWVLNNNTWSDADTQKVLNAIYKTIQANPNGKVVGKYDGIAPTGFDVQIDVDYTVDGMYDILLYYKGEIYHEDYGWSETYKPSRESQIQCLWAKEFNSQVTFYAIKKSFFLHSCQLFREI